MTLNTSTQNRLMIFFLALASMQAASQVPKNYALKWQDTFEGTRLDETEWLYRMGISGKTAQSAQLPGNVSLDGKHHLRIANKTESFGSASYTGGGVISRAAFRYGYYQVTAQTPADTGWHTAFWLSAGGLPLVSGNTYVSPYYTEVDGFEINSEKPKSVSMGFLTWMHGRGKVKDVRCDRNFLTPFDTSGAMHTYGIEWTEESLTYYIDGKEACSQPYPPDVGPHAPANIWLTSIGYLGPATTPPGAQAVFGPVQYYVRDYYINANEPGYAEYGGGWGSSSTPGYSFLPLRYGCQAGAVALYTPNVVAAGVYDVQFYKQAASENDSAAEMIVHAKDGPHARTVDLTSGTTGWVDLGTFEFAGNSAENLQVARGNNCLRTSMVKFVWKKAAR